MIQPMRNNPQVKNQIVPVNRFAVVEAMRAGETKNPKQVANQFAVRVGV